MDDLTQPSLRPPAPTHRQRFERLQERLRVATNDLKALADDAQSVLD